MFLYTMALGYPNSPTPDEKAAARDLLVSLQHLLPCDKCRVNYRAKMASGEARLSGALACSETLMRYIYELEADVAATNGSAIRSYDDTRAAILSNAYLKRETVARAAADVVSVRAPVTVLAIALPLTLLFTAVVTWAITRAALKARG